MSDSALRDIRHPVQNRITDTMSFNFALAKVFSIFMVVTGHWFTGTILWIPVTVGLFVFAYSSALFTVYIYGDRVNLKRFWSRKVQRLGLRFWIISAFLLPVIYFQNGEIWHWHSLLHLFGLSGFLNWFSIPNRSGFGAGLWFFTLLLIFYLFYPFLARINRRPGLSIAFAVLATIATSWLHFNVQMGHELWLTALAFLLGVFFGFRRLEVDPTWLLALLVSATAMLVGVNLFTTIKWLNFYLILSVSLLLVLWLQRVRLPQWRIFQKLLTFNDALLEVYLVHTYLFITPTGQTFVDYFVSMLVICVVAKFLSIMAKKVESQAFKKTEAAHYS